MTIVENSFKADVSLSQKLAELGNYPRVTNYSATTE